MTTPFDDENGDRQHSDGQLHDRADSSNSTVERLLLSLTPRATPLGVRDLVLNRLKSEAREELSASRTGWGLADWPRAFDFAVAALVLLTVTAWFAGATVHSQRMKQLLGPTSAERRAQRDARSLDSLANEEAIRGLQRQLATLYKQVRRDRGVSQTVHSPSLDLLPDLWRSKNAETHLQDSRRPRGNRSSGHGRLDLESQRTA